MTLANQSFTIRNTSTGAPEDGSLIPCYIGCCEKGTVDTVYTFTDPDDVVDTFGQGPLSEDLCYHLDVAGGPVRGIRATGGVVGTTTLTSHTHTSSSTGHVTGAGAAYDEYHIIVTITKSGDLATSEFTYSLDGGETTSPAILTPSGTTYAIPSTNVTLTFTRGAGALYYEVGDRTVITCTAPYVTTTNAGTATDALGESTDDSDFMVLSGQPATAAAGETMFAALDVDLKALQNDNTFYPAMMDCGSLETAATVKAAMASATSDLILAHYGRCRLLSSKPIVGWANPYRTAVCAVAARACQVGLSGDLKNMGFPQLAGASEMQHDERTAATALDGSRICTFRSWKTRGEDAVFISQGYIHSAAASVFDLWPLALIMQQVARCIHANQQTWIGGTPRCNTRTDKATGQSGAAGTIVEADATKLEAPVIRALDALLMQQTNADGNLGHVSGYRYWIDRTYDERTNRKHRVFFKAVSLSYINEVDTELSWTATL